MFASQSRENARHLAHLALITFSSAALLVALSGCSPEIEEKEGSVGTEASSGDVQKIINDALSGTGIEYANVGQFVEYETNYRVEQSAHVRTKKIRHELTAIKESDVNVTFTMLEDVYSFNLDGDVTDEKHGEFDITFNKAPTASAYAFVKAAAKIPAAFAASDKTPVNCDGIDDQVGDDGLLFDCTRYFNASSSLRRVRPPDAVVTRPGCNGLADCLMTVRYFKFDEVQWKNNRPLTTTTFTAEVALDVADLLYMPVDGGFSHTFPVLSLCQRVPYTDSGVTRMVTFCTVLKDFK